MKSIKLCLVCIGALSLSLGAQEPAVDVGKPAAVEEISQAELDAEMEAEMARIEAALEDAGEVEEFVPQKPLAADLPIALPSDI